MVLTSLDCIVLKQHIHGTRRRRWVLEVQSHLVFTDLLQLRETFNYPTDVKFQPHVFYSLWTFLLQWNGDIKSRDVSETAALHTSLRNPTLNHLNYRTNSGRLYSAASRINGIRLVLKSITSSLNPTCDKVFVEVCGDSMRNLLNFLQYGCLPNPVRVEECPPGISPFFLMRLMLTK